MGPGTTAGPATWILPNKPSTSPFIPAVKNNVSGSKPDAPIRNPSAHKPELVSTFPRGSRSFPRKAPVSGSNASIVPSPLLPISRAPAKSPKISWSNARPHGELRNVFVATLCRKLPFVSKTFTMPWLGVCVPYQSRDQPSHTRRIVCR
jgi:hypothetical protein